MYQIRKCERVTICYCSEVANLDPEKFKNISIPFEGESEEDLPVQKIYAETQSIREKCSPRGD